MKKVVGKNASVLFVVRHEYDGGVQGTLYVKGAEVLTIEDQEEGAQVLTKFIESIGSPSKYLEGKHHATFVYEMTGKTLPNGAVVI